MRVEAIIPKRKPIATGIIEPLRAELGAAGFAGDVIRYQSEYPPQRPPLGQAQSLGRRFGGRRRRSFNIRGYRRTGRYGRGWRMTFAGSTASRLVATAYNNVGYAVYVGGPRPGVIRRRQTDDMASRGWRSVSPTSRTLWAKYRPRIIRILTQRDPRNEAERASARQSYASA